MSSDTQGSGCHVFKNKKHPFEVNDFKEFVATREPLGIPISWTQNVKKRARNIKHTVKQLEKAFRY